MLSKAILSNKFEILKVVLFAAVFVGDHLQPPGRPLLHQAQPRGVLALRLRLQSFQPLHQPAHYEGAL